MSLSVIWWSVLGKSVYFQSLYNLVTEGIVVRKILEGSITLFLCFETMGAFIIYTKENVPIKSVFL